MREKTCCFTGPRTLPAEKMRHMILCLNKEIETLIGAGVTTFISGGAQGFEQIAASLIAAKKEMGYPIFLILALPYPNQHKSWQEKTKELYDYLLEAADEVHYISDTCTNNCMKERNHYMVEHSAYCICALLHGRNGIEETVKYAKQKNLRIVDVSTARF